MTTLREAAQRRKDLRRAVMPSLREAAALALEALDSCDAAHPSDGGRQWYDDKLVEPAITALRAALAEPQLAPAPGYCKHCKQYTIEEPLPAEPLPAEPVQEPVAWLFTNVQSGDYDFCYCEDDHAHDREMWHKQPLYTAPPQRLPLSDAEIRRIYETHRASVPLYHAIARTIERAHGIVP